MAWPADDHEDLARWADALIDDLARWVRSYERRPRYVGADRVLRAVYVWCAMAAARHEALDDSRLRARLAKCREDLVFEAERAFRMHRIALDLAAEIHTERAARRKWELRLRARRTGQSPRRPWTTDRLFARYVFGVFAHDDRRLPIAGPRGVLP